MNQELFVESTCDSVRERAHYTHSLAVRVHLLCTDDCYRGSTRNPKKSSEKSTSFLQIFESIASIVEEYHHMGAYEPLDLIFEMFSLAVATSTFIIYPFVIICAA